MRAPRTPAPRQLRGVIAAIPTPVRAAGPDHERMIALAKHLLGSGCDGLNVLGTTGEATSFSVEQRKRAMSAYAEAGLPMSRLMVGAGASAVADAVALSRHGAALGFAGILVLPPFYYKSVSDAGVIAYVREIVESTADTQTPIYLYNFPALSGVPYTLPLIKALVETFGNRIAGLKDSSGDTAYAEQAALLCESFDVFPSTEACLLRARKGPFAGCISATVNINPRHAAKAYAAANEAALTQAVDLRKIFDGIPLVPGVKHLLAQLHNDDALSDMMPPLAELTPVEGDLLWARYSALGC